MTGEHASAVPAEARSFQGQPAGLVTRMAAAVLDAAVVGLVLVAGYATWAGALFLIDPRGFTLPEGSPLLSLAAAWGVLMVYLTGAWSLTGRTYGDQVLGLRVVGARGSKLRPGSALIRALACSLFPIGLFWCAGSRVNRSLQDTLLRTSVLYDWQPTLSWGNGDATSKTQPDGPVDT